MSLMARNAHVPILNFHRVANDDYCSGNIISPSLFDEFISWLKTKFHILTFAELQDVKPQTKSPIVLSFDDGYADFLEIVVPILKKHGIQANQNVIPQGVDEGLPPRNVILGDFIAQAPESLLRETALPGLPGGGDPQRRVEHALIASAAFKNQTIAQQDAAWPLLRRSIERFDGFRPTRMLSRGDVRQLSEEYEFGMHSFEHATMPYETDEYLIADARKCSEWWLELTGGAPAIYAFPNGAGDFRRAALVQEQGYSTVLLVGERFTRADASIHPRISMYGSSVDELRARALRLVSIQALVQTASIYDT